MESNFYQAFEEKYRGSADEIKSRLRIYFPFIQPLVTLFEDASAVDLGCGRGEWLELLKELSIDLQGVDIDENMLKLCKEKGLNVKKYEAISFLKSLPAASQVIVSGFHIIEHIDFSQLQLLVEEALRVLKQGGLLILETPNPENIIVGTSGFYLDPTHTKPIPPLLLSFLPEYYGFYKIKILRLQDSVFLMKNKEITLLDVLNGVSLDYAVIAQKAGEEHLISATNQAFNAEYGQKLERLANIYEQQIDAKNQRILEQIYSSYSWKITKPLRWLGMHFKAFIGN